MRQSPHAPEMVPQGGDVKKTASVEVGGATMADEPTGRRVFRAR